MGFEWIGGTGCRVSIEEVGDGGILRVFVGTFGSKSEWIDNLLQ